MGFPEDRERTGASRRRERGPRPPDQQQILLRRAIAVGAAVLILILLVLAVRGCLNARKERAFENYVNDLASIATEANQLSESFFGRLNNPGERTELAFQNEVSADRGSAEGLLNRVQDLDVPDELGAAQTELELSFRLRRDALAGVANSIGNAFSDQADVRSEAISSIAQQMRVLIASDVLYGRARVQIAQELREQEIQAKVPRSTFVPDPIAQWVEPLSLAEKLAGVTLSTADGGVHGLGLVQTLYRPGEVPLEAGTQVTLEASDTPELEITVQNQGDSPESGIPVSFQVSGAAIEAEGSQTINRIAPGQTKSVTLAIQPPPEAGTSASIEVLVTPVPGEQVADNNGATYEVAFE